jgi:ribonucleoside-diphosphate reductase alpha subunit
MISKEIFLNNLNTQLTSFGCNDDQIHQISSKIQSRVPDTIDTPQMMKDLLVQVLSAECHRFTHFDSIAVAFLDDDHRKTSPSSFLAAVEKIQSNRDINNTLRPLLSDEFHRFILTHSQQIEQVFYEVISQSTHFPLSTFGWKTLYRSYLIRTHEGVIERPDHLWYRVALFLHRDNWDKVSACFKGLREGRFIHATPTLFSAGMVRPQMASCFSGITRVLTVDGYIPIQKIEIGTKVLTHTNKWKRVVQIHRNLRQDRKMYRVKFKHTETPVDVTEDHPFYVLNPLTQTFRWKPLSEVTCDDEIAETNCVDSLSLEESHEHILRGILYAYLFRGQTATRIIYIHRQYENEMNSLIENFQLPCRVHTYPRLKIEILDLDAIKKYQTPLIEYYGPRGDSAWRCFLRGVFMTCVTSQEWITFPSGVQNIEVNEVCRLKNIKVVEDNYTRIRIHENKNACCGCFGSGYRQHSVNGRHVTRLVSKSLLKEPPTDVYTLGVEDDHSYVVEGVIVKNCFLVGTEDSVEGIFQTLADCAQISKWAGGLGIHVSSIRGQNSYIYGTNGTSNGILPMLKVFNDTARYIDQCFLGSTMVLTRRGLLPIQDIEPMKDYVLTKNGTFELVKTKLVYVKTPKDLVSVSVRTPWETFETVVMTTEHTVQWNTGAGHTEMLPFDEAKSGWLTTYAPLKSFKTCSFSTDECFVLGYVYRYLAYDEKNKYRLYIDPDVSKTFLDFFETYYHGCFEFDENILILTLKEGGQAIDVSHLGVYPDEFLFLDPFMKSKAFYDGWTLVEPEHRFWIDYRMAIENVSSSLLHGRIEDVRSYECDTSTVLVYDLEVENDPSYQTLLGIVHNGGGKRNGAFAIYLEPWHSDIFAFLEAKKNVGSDEERARDLFYGLWIPDLFMKCVERGDDWYLMSPNQCPLLQSLWGKDFDMMYQKYVNEGKYIKKVAARDVWKEILRSQIETGTPYMLYKDSCNRKSNQQNLGTIRSSNLCCEIIEYSDHQEYAVCNLASISLPSCIQQRDVPGNLWIYGRKDCVYCQLLEGFLRERKIPFVYHSNSDMLNPEVRSRVSAGRSLPIVYIDDEYIGGFQETWTRFLQPEFNFERLGEITEQLVENLNIVIDKNAYPLDKCKISNMKHRPIGIGVQGLADVFFHLLISYDSDEARQLNTRIFETIYFHALKASNKLAQRDGFYSTYPGSPISKGIFHFEHTNEPCQLTCDWESLRTLIVRHGIRNSLLVAPMPTASTSQILGNTESFEPLTSNLYLRRTKAGEFYVCNTVLRKLFEWMHMWNNDTIDHLVIFKGSVQKLALPPFLKSIFRTVWELPQKTLIDMAADRQMFIDQSQSFNIYLQDPNMEKLTKIHFYGWKKGLKTGSYYVRSRSSLSSQNFTIDPLKEKEKLCDVCSA